MKACSSGVQHEPYQFMCKVPTIVGVQVQADVVFTISIAAAAAAATPGIVVNELPNLFQTTNSVTVELQM